MVELVAAWMTQPAQNKYSKIYQASLPVHVAPPTGPVKASRMMTARDTYSLLTKIFGEINESTTNLELPINWATNNSVLLDVYVDTSTITDDLAEFIDYNPPAVLTIEP